MFCHERWYADFMVSLVLVVLVLKDYGIIDLECFLLERRPMSAKSRQNAYFSHQASDISTSELFLPITSINP